MHGNTDMKTPTKMTYEGLDQAYAYFNKKLFGGKLPDCLITVRKHGKARGFFHGEVFESADGNEIRDEIALNMQYFKDRTPAQTLSTLVHEMVHLEQHHFGTPSRSGYHNKEWADLMDRVGLTPTETGEPGGRRTGQRVTHMIVEGGPFDQAFKARTFAIPYHDRQRDPEAAQRKLKITYLCPHCDDRATGKPGLKLHCSNGHRAAPMSARLPLHAVAA
jgi:hypothetical protein